MPAAPPSNAALDPAERTILLVEDNPAYIRLVRELLNETGLEAVSLEWVNSLQKAFDRLEAEPVDLILLDLVLPDAQGRQTLQAMLDRADTTPIIVLTGLDDDELAKDALNHGATDYLRKGNLGPERLARALRYALDAPPASGSTTPQPQHRLDLLESMGHELEAAADTLQEALEHLDPLAPEPTKQQLTRFATQAQASANALEHLANIQGRTPNRDRIPLEGLIDGVLHELSAQGNAGGRVTWQPDPDATIMGDPELLNHLLTLLLGRILNRDQAHPDGIEIETSARSARWEVRIRDPDPLSGPERSLDALFNDPDPTNGLPGPLARGVCEAIVAHHGGRWWLAPGPQNGYELTLSLPAASTQPQPLDALQHDSTEAEQQEAF